MHSMWERQTIGVLLQHRPATVQARRVRSEWASEAFIEPQERHDDPHVQRDFRVSSQTTIWLTEHLDLTAMNIIDGLAA